MVYVLQQDNVLKEMIKMPDKIKIGDFEGHDDCGKIYIVGVYKKLINITRFGDKWANYVSGDYWDWDGNRVYKIDDNTYYMIVSGEKIIIRRK